MKILNVILCIFLINLPVFAASDRFSHIELPVAVFFDIEEVGCDNECLNELVQNGKFFSFLSKYQDFSSTKQTQETYLIYGQMFNILIDMNTQTIKLAVLIPQKTIKNYALTSTNAVIAYLLKQSNDFDLAVFNSGDESESAIVNTLNDIRKSGYSHVIAPITQDGIQTLLKNSDGFYIFIPTLHQSLFEGSPSNIFFGGIDYNSQIRALSDFSNGFAVVFSDESKLGLNLNQLVKNQDGVVLQEVVISSAKDNIKRHFESGRNFNNSSIYLNTPLITTSLIASQIRVYKYAPFSLLSTQINYQPSLLIFTQYDDRKGLYLANSIGEIDEELDSINSFLGNNMEYEYVNYAVSIGVEYFNQRFFEKNSETIFSEQMNKNNQIEYRTRIYKADRYGFLPQTKFSYDEQESEDSFH